MFFHVSQIIQRRKSDANKQDFENFLNLTWQAQSTPKTIEILTKVFCTRGPNLVVLAWTGDVLSRGQTLNGVNFDFEAKFDLQGQGQSPSKTIGVLINVFTYMIQIWWSYLKRVMSYGQTSSWLTHGLTHTLTHIQTTGNDNTRRPKLASGEKYNKDAIPYIYSMGYAVGRVSSHCYMFSIHRSVISWYYKRC